MAQTHSTYHISSNTLPEIRVDKLGIRFKHQNTYTILQCAPACEDHPFHRHVRLITNKNHPAVLTLEPPIGRQYRLDRTRDGHSDPLAHVDGAGDREVRRHVDVHMVDPGLTTHFQLEERHGFDVVFGLG